MSEISPKDIKRNTVISAFSLFFQSGYSAFLGLIANLVVTIILSPNIFGIYITVLSIISILNYFSDIGLAASLVQKKEITDDDISTTFTIQQILIISVIAIGFFSTDFVRNFYNLPSQGVYLYWALLLSFLISSLKTIPSIFLERQIKFQKVVFVQIVENTTFYVTVIILALFGFKLESFTIAVILRAVVGILTMYKISFWKPRIGINLKSLKTLVSYGAPYQANSFLALIKDDFLILYLGKILGFESLGYIGWAKKWAEAPIRIIMDNVSRVLFPLISRVQDDTKKIRNIVERILLYQSLLLIPLISGMIVLMDLFVAIIPKYSKWTPALPLFYLFAISAMLATFSSPFTNLFNALGKIRITFKLMIFWTVSIWILTTILSSLFDKYGFPLSSFLLSFSFIIVIFIAKKNMQFSFFKPVKPAVISSTIMFVILFFMKVLLYKDLNSILVLILSGALIYLSLIRFVFRIKIEKELKYLFRK